MIAFSAPPIAGRDEPFRSGIREHAKGRTRALEERAVEMLARGLSVCDKLTILALSPTLPISE